MQEKIAGIYCIENIINNKKYIGKSIDISYRFTGHKRDLHENRHPNPYLQYSYNKYGIKNFNFYILEKCEKDSLAIKEIHFIKKYKTKNRDFGYNLTDGGEGTLGRIPSEESRMKASLSNKGKIRSDEVRKTISIYSKKRIHTVEENRKISEAMLGKQRGKKKIKTSSYLGVCKRKYRKKFEVQITYEKMVFRLGAYYSESDAAKAYDSAAFFLYGKEAKLNFPNDYIKGG
jgi:group I intron endonuclease